MARASWVPLALCLTLAGALPAQTPESQAVYRALLQRAESGDSTVDFAELRLRYAASPGYAPYDLSERQDSVMAALNRSDFKRAATLGDSLLLEQPLGIRGRLMRAYAAEQLADSVAAERHRAFAFRLIHSVETSGDGTRDHPYLVIAIEEEYALLGLKGLESRTQVLGKCASGNPCDILHARGSEGPEKELYFDVHLPRAHLDRALKH